MCLYSSSWVVPYSVRREFSFHLSMRIIPAHRKYRHKKAGTCPWHSDLRCGKDFLSRPIIGHTPRKLPAQAAISRIIAVPGGGFLCHCMAVPAQASLVYLTSLELSSRISLFFIKFFRLFCGFCPCRFWTCVHGRRMANGRRIFASLFRAAERSSAARKLLEPVFTGVERRLAGSFTTLPR